MGSWLRLGLGQGLGLRLGLGLGEGVGLGSRVVQGAWKVLAMYARSASPPTEPVRPKMHAYLLYRCGVHRQERKVSLLGSSWKSAKFLKTSQSSVRGTLAT